MKKISRQMLKNVYIKNNPDGISIWIKERVGNKVHHHWLIDASTVLKDGEIRFGINNIWNYVVRYNTDINGLEIVKK